MSEPDAPAPVVGPYVVDVDVRWGDQDALGHVNHAVVVALMAEARMQWLSVDAVEQGHEDFRLPKVVASLTIDYASPVEYGCPLAVAMSVVRLGTRSYTLRHDATQRGETRFTGTTVLVPRDAENGQARALTERERAYLTGFLRADAA